MGIKIHPTAEVQTSQIGEGTLIWQNCVVLAKAIIGCNCNINFNVFIENDVIIGDNVTIKPGVQIWDGLRIGNNVFIGPNATFTNDLVPRSKHYPESFAVTNILEGASIGANATIIAGITIGKYAMIGAGSVITKDVPPFTLWYGNPAKHKGYITRGGKILSLNLVCKEGKEYKLINNEPVLND
ncbi:acyltransferase [Perlabentimonas gracilis]|uniref:acyltransferase n=1 Tax=Perlabentimonas gracilis TaxID=2715279 RepID=UPI0014089072|nr:acyltransferase [Perlabentimonas gracilis]NHB69840.1 N-acetyltransferase [Perlabentimonas gracilis]